MKVTLDRYLELLKFSKSCLSVLFCRLSFDHFNHFLAPWIWHLCFSSAPKELIVCTLAFKGTHPSSASQKSPQTIIWNPINKINNSSNAKQIKELCFPDHLPFNNQRGGTCMCIAITIQYKLLCKIEGFSHLLTVNSV